MRYCFRAIAHQGGEEDKWAWSNGEMIKQNTLQENRICSDGTPPTINHALTWDWTVSSDVRSQRLAACNIAREVVNSHYNFNLKFIVFVIPVEVLLYVHVTHRPRPLRSCCHLEWFGFYIDESNYFLQQNYSFNGSLCLKWALWVLIVAIMLFVATSDCMLDLKQTSVAKWSWSWYKKYFGRALVKSQTPSHAPEAYSN
jgi:hypothetical protein